MSLSEGVQARVAYKAYATGVIASTTQPDSSADPGASAAQILRRVSTSLKLGKDTYQSEEVRTDRQIADFRHGTRRVTGSISGEFSPATYWELIEAALRGTDAAAITADQSDLTSVSADSSTAKVTFASGNPVSLGFRVGDVIRFSSLADADNNSKNFLVLAFGGANNREVTVFPAPDTMSPDTSFTVATVGRSVYVPSSGHVQRKFAFEVYHEDIDIARLFTECRVAGFSIDLPASGMSTIEIPVMGRDMEVYEDSAAPFFTNPAAATTTGIFAAVNGAIYLNGARIGVVTGLSIQLDVSPSSDAVVGQNIVPEVFLGRANVTGQVTAFFENADLIGNFLDEDEIAILVYLTTTSAPDSPAATIHLPRVKLGDADVAVSGEGGQVLTMPFQALLYQGSGAGIVATTIRIVDTQAT
ncbi:MAG: hypothetical protein KIS96_03475 [Bauldia sp.]|nr:hypothetical protein [Bauldia sp.]